MKARVALAHLHRDLVRVHFAATSVLPLIAAAEPKTLLVVRKLTRALDRILYPWLPEDTADLVDIDSPRAPWKQATTGLVFSVGRGYMRHALVCIANVRQHLGMRDMPVTIAYAGDRDLPPKYRDVMVQQVGQLDWLDLEKVLGGPEVIRKYEVKGWATKAFALLFAPYQHSILVDADTIFLQPPTPLLTTADPGYLATGTLFFHDRTLFPAKRYEMLDWVTKWLPSASPHARQTRHWRGLSAHEMESGVVAVDKARPGVMLTLLMMVAMNTQPLRGEQVYKVMHGDKETYFLAAEAVRELYTFMPGFGGTIGYLPAADRPHIKQPGRTTCGLLLHTDRAGEPVWFNGGVEKDKYAGDGELFNATHWVRDVDGKDVDWEFGDEVLDGFCMTKKGDEGEPREVSGELAALIDGLKGSYLKMKEAVGEDMWLGKA
ncbi:mannosyltransferase putative-domain-containing protein [Catenaria anguillulae PL171]|uniref:Mannosyltransferase putative-domain-containing protein n=1 Tax=Catenaria anguillulae PL171 TaxID=765915 RepID=A0A1Y2H7I7_9FUNG|nr:mannosyltransferase putative-domain-containing protein [Catenaria anguillulae PL171]